MTHSLQALMTQAVARMSAGLSHSVGTQRSGFVTHENVLAKEELSMSAKIDSGAKPVAKNPRRYDWQIIAVLVQPP